jgi:hypothetical protein
MPLIHHQISSPAHTRHDAVAIWSDKNIALSLIRDETRHVIRPMRL